LDSERCVEALAGRLGVSGRLGGWYQWRRIEQSLGLRLPDDYKLLVETFPPGVFRGLVQINRPGDYDEPPSDFLGFYAQKLEYLQGLRAAGHGTFPHPLFPESGGLLPWARGRRFELIFWLTSGSDPNTWPVVCADYDCIRWQTFPGTACAFLTEVVEGRFDVSLFGVDIADAPAFRIIDAAVPAKPKGAARPRSFWKAKGRASNAVAELSARLGPSTATSTPTDWQAAEQRLGRRLPADYKAFVDRYGPGTWLDIVVAAPGGSGATDLFAPRPNARRAA
jgi:hypothetical protein